MFRFRYVCVFRSKVVYVGFRNAFARKTARDCPSIAQRGRRWKAELGRIQTECQNRSVSFTFAVVRTTISALLYIVQ